MILFNKNLLPVVVTQKVDKILPSKTNQSKASEEEKKIEQKEKEKHIAQEQKAILPSLGSIDSEPKKSAKESQISIKTLPLSKPNGTIRPNERTKKITRKRKIADLENSTDADDNSKSMVSNTDTPVVSSTVSSVSKFKKRKNLPATANSCATKTTEDTSSTILSSTVTASGSQSMSDFKNSELTLKRTVAAVRRISNTGEVKKLKVNHALNPQDLTILKVSGGDLKNRSVIRAATAVNDVPEKHNLIKTVAMTGSGKPKTIFVRNTSSLLNSSNSPKLLVKARAHSSGNNPNEKELVKRMLEQKSAMEKDPLSISGSKPMTSIPIVRKKENKAIVYYTLQPRVKDESSKEVDEMESNATISNNKSDKGDHSKVNLFTTYNITVRIYIN